MSPPRRRRPVALAELPFPGRVPLARAADVLRARSERTGHARVGTALGRPLTGVDIELERSRR